MFGSSSYSLSAGIGLAFSLVVLCPMAIGQKKPREYDIVPGGRTVEALPIDRVLEICRKYNALRVTK